MLTDLEVIVKLLEAMIDASLPATVERWQELDHRLAITHVAMDRVRIVWKATRGKSMSHDSISIPLTLAAYFELTMKPY